MRFDIIYDKNNIPTLNIKIREIGTFAKKYQSDILKNTVVAIDYIIETPNVTQAKVLGVNINDDNGELIMDMNVQVFAEDIYGGIEKLLQLAIDLEEYEVAGRIKEIEKKINLNK